MWVKTKEFPKKPKLVDVSDGIISRVDRRDGYFIYFDKYFECSVDEVVLGAYETKEERDSAFDRLSKRLNERDGAMFL